ncbi:MAG: hypothetical protein QOH95_616 [Gaiellaceae bacterium]|jgi:hypothetical protein|nr:hypothetical protein [Gaiellaceae bacterium]
MSQFQASLAERFSTITDVANLSRAATPVSRFAGTDLASIISHPINVGQFLNPPVAVQPQPAQPPPLTPGDANTFIGSVAQTPEQIATAAVHAARIAFEAVPTAQNGDVIDASISNGFRSAMITLLSLAEATILQLTRQRQTAPPPAQPPASPPPSHVPPVNLPPNLPPVNLPPEPPEPPELPPRHFPPIQIDPGGILHIDPAVLAQIQPAVNPAPDTQGVAGGIVGSPQLSTPQLNLPTIDLGGQLFQPITATHPETGAVTTIFAPIAAAGSAANISPVSGGGFHLLLDSPAAAAGAAGLAGGVAAGAAGAAAGLAKGIGG